MELRETLSKCTCIEHDPYCCQIHGNCPVCVKPEEPEDVVLGYKTSLVAQTMDSMTNNKKLTVVEWLQKTLRHNSISIFSGNIADQAKNLEQVFQQAKEMEKERMMNNNPDKTNNTVTTGQNNTGTYPEPGQIWSHYKGGRYEIIAMCNHTTTNEVMVIYKSLSFNGFHARPYSEWHDEVWNGPHCVRRFTLVSW